MNLIQKLVIAFCLLFGHLAVANEEQYKDLKLKMKVSLEPWNSDFAFNEHIFTTEQDVIWLREMTKRLNRIVPQSSVMRDQRRQIDFLRTIYYESVRAGLDPQWVLSIIQVESAFRKFAISSAGARGYMQVMPFWVDVIGDNHHRLFDLRTNIRYGTTIFRHYLDIEQGNYFRALGRYNGSLGKKEYSTLVYNAWQRNWQL